MWKHLAIAMSDPDADFLDMLQAGVPLGVNQPLHPSPAWPINSDCTSEPIPLQDCTSAWKSARDHHSLVQELVHDEVQSGFVAHVPGGIQELKSKFKRTAVGKLGVVIAEGRAPRLVVDSSISNVTANTVLPNHMLFPRINDVIRRTPTAMSQGQLIQLTLTFPKLTGESSFIQRTRACCAFTLEISCIDASHYISELRPVAFTGVVLLD